MANSPPTVFVPPRRWNKGSPTLIMATGASGGHIYPALVLARKISQMRPEVNIVFVGGANSLEESIIPKAGYPFFSISAYPAPRFFSLLYPSFLIRLLRGTLQAAVLFRKVRPRTVVGFGGFASFPTVAAGIFLKIPTLVHEQNLTPGRANRLLSYGVKAIALSFEETKRYFPGIPRRKFFVSGNPVRRPQAEEKKKYSDKFTSLETALPKARLRPPWGDLPLTGFTPLEIPKNLARDNGNVPPERISKKKRFLSLTGFTLLVMGGSRGSSFLNRTAAAAVVKLAPTRLFSPRIIHIAGKRDYLKLKSFYRQEKVEAEVLAYLDDITSAYKRSDLVIARAGATTLAEIAANGCAAIIVPYPYARGHQKENAEFYSKRGAVHVVAEEKLSPGVLAGEILSLSRRPARISGLRKAASSLDRPDADRILAEKVLTLLDGVSPN